MKRATRRSLRASGGIARDIAKGLIAHYRSQLDPAVLRAETWPCDVADEGLHLNAANAFTPEELAVFRKRSSVDPDAAVAWLNGEGPDPWPAEPKRKSAQGKFVKVRSKSKSDRVESKYLLHGDVMKKDAKRAMKRGRRRSEKSGGEPK